MIGTPAYMPPEQVLGQPVDARSDLYSMGVVLYQLLAGALPFSADNAIATLQKQISENPTPLACHVAGLPDWCEPVVQRALAKPPGDRFQSADAFREALAATIAATPRIDLAKVLNVSLAAAENQAADVRAPKTVVLTVVGQPQAPAAARVAATDVATGAEARNHHASQAEGGRPSRPPHVEGSQRQPAPMDSIQADRRRAERSGGRIVDLAGLGHSAGERSKNVPRGAVSGHYARRKRRAAA